jgi:hypothetical protein
MFHNILPLSDRGMRMLEIMSVNDASVNYKQRHRNVDSQLESIICSNQRINHPKEKRAT